LADGGWWKKGKKGKASGSGLSEREKSKEGGAPTSPFTLLELSKVTAFVVNCELAYLYSDATKLLIGFAVDFIFIEPVMLKYKLSTEATLLLPASDRILTDHVGVQHIFRLNTSSF
jgi:hypothetical protein